WTDFDSAGPGTDGRRPAVTRAMPRVSAAWLSLRESADAAARAGELVEPIRRHLGVSRAVIHDLGSGTGSTGRWLSPQLSCPQHWIMYDRDADLLHRSMADMIDSAANALLTVETRLRDVTRLTADDLESASLI